jgi:predicted acyl esterase
MYLQAGSAGALGRRAASSRLGFWRKLLEHPAYDAFWRDQAVDKMLAGQPLTVPVMIVHSLWDQEDIYGAPAVYRRSSRRTPATTGCSSSWARGTTASRSGREPLGALKFGATPRCTSARSSCARSSSST